MVLTQEIINHLFEMYKEIVGSSEEGVPKLEKVLKTLNQQSDFECRAGSRWSGDSKFMINYSGARFYPNYTPKTTKEKDSIETAVALFEKQAREYIESLS